MTPPLGDSRSEFLSAESLDLIKYNRQGGWFVSTRKAFFLGLLVCGLVIIVAILVHYLGPCPITENVSKVEDILEANGIIPPQLPDTNPITDFRLPTNVVPLFYRLKVSTFLEDGFKFKGEVKITVACKGSTSKVVLHSKELNITDQNVTVSEVQSGSYLKTSSKEYDKDRDFYIIYLEDTLMEGFNYTIKMEFSGILNDVMYGYYRSSYVERNTNITRWIAGTQFESTYARQAFPCFDEPALKAKFQISLGRRENMTSLSNMPLRKSEPMRGIDGFVWDHYKISPPMSTYTVAFVISNFSPIQSNESMSFHVWARKNVINQGQYAAVIGPPLLSFFEEYFNVSYPLPKMDLVALPDFAFGAMENWGLTTFRESMLLVDESTSTADKERVALTVSHEMSHEWFGNLVTPEWWDYFWLNEGFAKYMQYIGVNHIEPSWAMRARFVVDVMHPVLEEDSLQTSHPVSLQISNPLMISQIFDPILYSKGACLVRMIKFFLTEETFMKGLNNYLNKKKYGVAKQDDLWTALTEAGQNDSVLLLDTSVKDVMDSWTLQRGYPVITVVRNYADNSVTLQQEPFFLKSLSTPKQSEDSLWWVPVTYRAQDDNSTNSTVPVAWMKKEKTLTINNMPSKDKWVLFNLEQEGYFRVNYDTDSWNALITQLKSENYTDLSPITRAQLVDDVLNLARAGKVNYALALNLTLYLHRETAYAPWTTALENLRYLDRMLRNSDIYGLFQTYVINLLEPVHKSLGREERKDESHRDKLLRVSMLFWLCQMEYKPCLDWARNMYYQWMNSSSNGFTNVIPVDFRPVVICTAIRRGGREEWDFGWERLLDSTMSPADTSVLLTNLACSEEPWIIQRYLKRALEDNEGIRLQDVYRILRAMPNNVIGSTVTFNYIRNNWDKLYKRYGDSEILLSELIKDVTLGLTSKFDLQELIQFRNDNKGKFSYASLAMNQSVERLQLKVNWQRNFYPTVEAWFKSVESFTE